MDEQLYSCTEIARLLKVDPSVVHGWISSGELAAEARTGCCHKQVKTADLISFCEGRDLPVPASLRESSIRVLVVDDNAAAREILVDSLEPIASEGSYDTAELVTPWGQALPLNRMECAESAILLRATFAAWHRLPFFMTAYSPTLGQNVHYGHFGMRTESGAAVPLPDPPRTLQVTTYNR